MKTLLALVLASSLAGCAAVGSSGGAMSGPMKHGGMHGMHGMHGMAGMQGGMQGMKGMQGKEATAGLFGNQARAGASGGMCGGQDAQGGGGMCGGSGGKEGGGMCGGQDMQGMMQQRMDAMDADLDGMLSRDEFMKAQMAIFDALPKNPQGLVEARSMAMSSSGCPMMKGSMRH